MSSFHQKIGYFYFLVLTIVILVTGCSGTIYFPTPLPGPSTTNTPTPSIGPSAIPTPSIEPSATPSLPVHNSTQGTFFSLIQNAINASSPGDIIIVSPGTYFENIDFIGKNITVRSTNPSDSGTVASTIIDGNHTGAVVSFQNGETSAAVLQGFTIINGSGFFHLGLTYLGGGIWCYSSSPTISNNIIRDNNAVGGGGIYCYSSSPVITNNTIYNNSSSGNGGGIECDMYSSPTITNNTVNNNSATEDGGGIWCYSSSPTINNNIINNNASNIAGGIYCDMYSSAIISGNTINNNRATNNGGGIYCSLSSPTITNNTISGNSASKGGGIMSYSTPTIAGNTLSSNGATQQGGGIFVSNASNVKDSYGNTWPRSNVPPNTELNNTYSGNTHQGGHTTGADVYFE
ncbi:MAG: right-handed parallel beta-helix repeat-containing protein [Candidatus Atribacteria bacterium]|nr:right-handed parallel beta-helix repeat-containing protein [Candidatus Atribacteria bacterium]